MMRLCSRARLLQSELLLLFDEGTIEKLYHVKLTWWNLGPDRTSLRRLFVLMI